MMNPAPTEPTTPEQFAVLVVVALVGLFALGVTCFVVAARLDAKQAESAGQLLKLGCGCIGVSLVGAGILSAVRRWLD